MPDTDGSQVMSGIHFKDVSLQKLPPYLLRKDVNMDVLAEVGYFKKILALYQTPFHEASLLPQTPKAIYASSSKLLLLCFTPPPVPECTQDSKWRHAVAQLQDKSLEQSKKAFANVSTVVCCRSCT